MFHCAIFPVNFETFSYRDFHSNYLLNVFLNKNVILHQPFSFEEKFQSHTNHNHNDYSNYLSTENYQEIAF